MEEIIKTIHSQHTTLIEKLKELEKQFNWYKKNCLIKIIYYLQKNNNENYEEQIIEGESSLDIILEEIERSNILFQILNSIILEIEIVLRKETNNKSILNLKNKIKISFEKEFKKELF